MQYKVELPYKSPFASEDVRKEVYRSVFDNEQGRKVLHDIVCKLCKYGGNISATTDDYVREHLGRQGVAHDLIQLLYGERK